MWAFSYYNNERVIIIMAQILKDEIKERIVESAKTEFLEDGYEKASMRKIAGKSQITVGNLYHYFKNKEELNSFIVGPALGKIQKLILKLSGNRVDILHSEDIHLTKEDMREMMDSLGNGLVDIYMEHKTEVNILMMRSSLNKYLCDWVALMIRRILSDNYGIPEDSEGLKLIAQGYAESIFAGLKTILRNNRSDRDTLTRVVKIYIESYVDMLDVDFLSKIREGESV